jgi:hypothetical protein
MRFAYCALRGAPPGIRWLLDRAVEPGDDSELNGELIGRLDSGFALTHAPE